jgi:hypothetical protein
LDTDPFFASNFFCIEQDPPDPSMFEKSATDKNRPDPQYSVACSCHMPNNPNNFCVDHTIILIFENGFIPYFKVQIILFYNKTMAYNAYAYHVPPAIT